MLQPAATAYLSVLDGPCRSQIHSLLVLRRSPTRPASRARRVRGVANVKSITEFHRKYADDPMSSQTYCRKCHGDMKKEKGGVRVRNLQPRHAVRDDRLRPRRQQAVETLVM